MNLNKTVVKRFVREVLGCNCSDEVFNHIGVKRSSTTIKSCPADYEINIGGRLLIVVSGHQAVLAQNLGKVMEEGMAARDAAGFNRFRLVVLADNVSQVEKVLSQEYKKLSTTDGKAHFHVIAKNDLPELFAGSK